MSDYTVSYSGILPDYEKDGLKEFKIHITGLYGTDGYYNQLCKSYFEDFKRHLQKYWSYISSDPVEFVDNGDGVDTIEGTSFPKCHVYLHPEDFTGYLSEEAVEKLCKYINGYSKQIIYIGSNTEEANHITLYAKIDFMYDSVALSDEDYEKLLYQYADEIIERTNEHYKKLKDNEKAIFIKYAGSNCGWDFAKTARIPRTGDSFGYCISDVDIQTVNNIITEAIEKGLIGG